MPDFSLKRYFDKPPSKELFCLYVGKTMLMAVTALLGIFLPIFLYNLFDHNLRVVVSYYGLSHLFYGLFVFFGAKLLLNKLGYKAALQISTFLGALFYAIFYLINSHNYIYLIPVSLVVLVAYRLFYWLPYHIDFTKFSDRENRGRQVGFFEATRSILGIISPFIAGALIVCYGFNVLFLIAVFFYVLSGIPYLFISPIKEHFIWKFRETWNYFFSRKRRRTILAYTAHGAENFVDAIIWPIFIYQLLRGNFLEVGIISTLIVGVSVLMQLILGRHVDLKFRKEKILKWGSFFHATGWIIKVFILTPLQIFVVGVYHKFTRIFLAIPFDSLNYDIAADQGPYVDEFTVLREMATNLGKASMALLVIFISFFFGLQWTFLLAVLATVFIGLLKKQDLEFFRA